MDGADLQRANVRVLCEKIHNHIDTIKTYRYKGLFWAGLCIVNVESSLFDGKNI
jgi:hypothetical protein